MVAHLAGRLRVDHVTAGEGMDVRFGTSSLFLTAHEQAQPEVI
jgi:hypothetical protein